MPAAGIATAVYDSGNARVRLNLSGFAAGTTAVQVTRKDMTTGRTALVRGARNILTPAPASDAIQLYDYEAPPGHTVQYGYFQFPDNTLYTIRPEKFGPQDYGAENADVGGWSNNGNAIISPSNTQVRTGAWSMRLEAIAAGDMEAILRGAGGSSSDFRATPGDYTVGYGTRAGLTARTTQLAVDWLNAGGAVIGSGTVSQANSAAAWSSTSATLTAPAGTVGWQARARVLAPVNTERHYFDDFTFGDLAGVRAYDVDRVWLKSLTRPYLSRPVLVGDYTPYEHVVRGTVTPAVRRSVPIGGGDVRGGRRFGVTLKLTPDERDDLDNLLAVGGIWLWHKPGADVGLPASGYVMCTKAQERRRGTAQSGERWLDLTLEQTQAPDADLVAAAASWDNLKATYATWSDLGANVVRWNDALAAVANPAEVIVV